MNEKDIDDFLKEFEPETETKEIAETGKKDMTVINFDGNLVPVDDDDAMMAAVFNSVLEDKKHSDELYNYYVSRIEMDRDRSDSVREGMAKAVELRTNSTSNLIRLLDMRKKYSAKNSGNSLVNLQLSPRETGIDIKNLTNEILNG